MKHLKLFENQNQKIWVYQESDDNSWGFGISTYLFDDKEVLFKFILNKAYNIVESSFENNEKEEYYKLLDERNDYEAVIETINDWVGEGTIDSDNRLNVDIEIIHREVQLAHWIETRRTAKKYNL